MKPEDLAAHLGVAAEYAGGFGAAAPVSSNGAASTEREPVDLSLYPRITEEIGLPSVPPDRSKDTYRLACVCRDYGLSLGQFRTVIDGCPDLAGRAGARRDDDVLRAWERACNEWHARAAAFSAAAGAAPSPPPPVPGAPAAAPPPGPGRFFGRQGFRALDCAIEVMSTVMCGYGRLDERFYTYDGGVWVPGKEPIAAEIVRLLGNRYRPNHIKNVTDIIEHAYGTARITDAPLAELINVPNGMVQWETGALLPHDPAYLSTVQLPVEYAPTATCPQFDKYLAEVLPPDLLVPTSDGGLGFVWELIGYTILSGNPIQKAILLWGKGRNGKGTLIRVIQSLIGENNYTSVTLYELIEDKFARAQLYGKLANLAGDLDSKWLENTATFKKITGHDSLQGEYKYGAKFNFTPWALPFYSANKPFGSADSSEGWVGRWIVVPFPNSFLGREDLLLEDRLTSESELRGILAKAVAALPALMRRGNFAELPSLTATRTAFVLASDAVRAWLDECCVIDPAEWTPRTDLYRSYHMHSARDGGATLGAREFYNRVEQVGGIRTSKRGGTRGFIGVRIGAVSGAGFFAGQTP